MDKRILAVGAGISGLTLARVLAEDGFEVTVLEKRQTIGGNLYDFVDGNGIRIQTYGELADSGKLFARGIVDHRRRLIGSRIVGFEHDVQTAVGQRAVLFSVKRERNLNTTSYSVWKTCDLG